MSLPPPKSRRVTVLAALTITASAAAILGLAFAATDGGKEKEKELAASIASQEPEGWSAACASQDDGAWFRCETSGDPTSGWRTYRVTLDDEDCWEAVERLPRPRAGEASGRKITGCLG